MKIKSKNNIISLLIFISIISNFLAFKAFAYDWEKNITKVNDNFYTAKIKDRELWLAIVRVTDENLRFWQNYVDEQTNRRTVFLAQKIMPTFSVAGSEHFKLILEKVDLRANEIFVAYIAGKDPTKDPESLDKDIYMFVSVITNKDALITSHMGISASYEGIKANQRGISLDLHSFAAKVMLLLNKNRKYMVTAPVEIIEKLIITSLPANSVFAGTREMQKILKERKDISLEDFKKENPEIISKIEAENSKMDFSSYNDTLEFLKEELQNKAISKEEYENEMAEFEEKLKGNFLEINAEGKIVRPEALQEKRKQKKIDEAYNSWKQPFSFRGWEGVGDLVTLFQKYPPLLSVDGKNGISAVRRMTIYDKNHPNDIWLNITKGDPSYNWVFLGPSQPATTGIHYLVSDLEALANSKKLEEI